MNFILKIKCPDLAVVVRTVKIRGNIIMKIYAFGSAHEKSDVMRVAPNTKFPTSLTGVSF